MSADDQDRLIFGEGPLGGPLPDSDLDADTPPRRNRAFVYIAVAMAGLILLGVLGLVFVLTVWLPGRQQAQYAAATAEYQALTREAAAWTATPAPTATPLPPTSTATLAPTLTPEPTATSTKVVSKGDVTMQPTSTPTTAPGGDKTTPPAGLGSASLAAIGVGLAGLLLAVRKLRG